MNTAADFPSSLDVDPKENVLLRVMKVFQTTPKQVNIQSSDIHEEDQFCFLPEDDSETEEDNWERKQRAEKNVPAPELTARPKLSIMPQNLKRKTYL